MNFYQHSLRTEEISDRKVSVSQSVVLIAIGSGVAWALLLFVAWWVWQLAGR